MSFDKNYSNRKDWRKGKLKNYNKAIIIDRTCRNHGSCPYCKGNRQHSTNKRKASTEDQLEWYK